MREIFGDSGSHSGMRSASASRALSRSKIGSVQGQERIVGEFDLLRAARERFVELDEGDRAAVDGDLESEVEPVVLLRLDRGDLDVRFSAELSVGLLLPAGDDLEVLDLLEPGQDVDDEVGGVGVVDFDIGDAAPEPIPSRGSRPGAFRLRRPLHPRGRGRAAARNPPPRRP
jgi:hypothetical protein